MPKPAVHGTHPHAVTLDIKIIAKDLCYDIMFQEESLLITNLATTARSAPPPRCRTMVGDGMVGNGMVGTLALFTSRLRPGEAQAKKSLR